jgi:hypothetical protein
MVAVFATQPLYKVRKNFNLSSNLASLPAQSDPASLERLLQR